MARQYENTFIVRPDLSPSQVESLADKFSKILQKEGAEVGKIEYCGLRHLAYPIKKNSKGHYVLMNITAEPATVLEMERNMRLDEDLLRFLTILVEEHDTSPSALMQQSRSPRDSYRGDNHRHGREERENPGVTKESDGPSKGKDKDSNETKEEEDKA